MTVQTSEPFIVKKDDLMKNALLIEFASQYKVNQLELVEIVERGLYYGTNHEKFTSCINPYSKSPNKMDYINLIDNIKKSIINEEKPKDIFRMRLEELHELGIADMDELQSMIKSISNTKYQKELSNVEFVLLGKDEYRPNIFDHNELMFQREIWSILRQLQKY